MDVDTHLVSKSTACGERPNRKSPFPLNLISLLYRRISLCAFIPVGNANQLFTSQTQSALPSAFAAIFPPPHIGSLQTRVQALRMHITGRKPPKRPTNTSVKACRGVAVHLICSLAEAVYVINDGCV